MSRKTPGSLTARAAAGEQPLAVQRREAGEHREAHAQARVGGPAPDGEGVPRRAASPRRSRSAPATSGGAAGGGGRRRPGMDEQRRVAALERLEHRAEALVAGRVARARRPPRTRRRSPRRAAPRQRRRVGRGEADRGPGAERRGQRGDAVVIGVEQRLGLGGGQRLDAERDRRGDQRAVEAVGVARAPRGASGSWSARSTRRLAARPEAQRPAVATPRISTAARGAATAPAAAARARDADGCRRRRAVEAVQ